MNRHRSSELRVAAATTLQRVLGEGRSLAEAMPERDADQARLRAICYGVLRQLPVLRALLGSLLKTPLKARAGELEALLLAAIYELGWMRTAEHAVINQAVAAARALGMPWGAGLVNGVLRSYQRAGKPREVSGMSPEESLLHPAWLIAALRAAWPQEFDAIIAANNLQGPLWLRVNAAKTTVAGYLRALTAEGIAAEAGAWGAQAIKLDQPLAVEQLPGFAGGQVSVQDSAAQLAAPLLGCRPGDRVLDACAAPGGKSAHLLELTPDIDLTALDIDSRRCRRLRETLDRLGLKARLLVADATDGAWWDGQRFDRILLDAPCSATGVIRRHPDIKWRRQPSDVAALAALQRRLLEALWPMLDSGGRLLYATCSLLPQENHRLVAAFLDSHGDAAEVSIEAAWGRPAEPGRQILPGDGDSDGFYYALLEKR